MRSQPSRLVIVIITTMEEKAVRKLLHRRIKDCVPSDGFRNFLITLFCLVSIIFYLGGKPNFSEFRVRERVDIKKLMSAVIEVAEAGGKEVGFMKKKNIFFKICTFSRL